MHCRDQEEEKGTALQGNDLFVSKVSKPLNNTVLNGNEKPWSKISSFGTFMWF
jgi:hypothetical protein